MDLHNNWVTDRLSAKDSVIDKAKKRFEIQKESAEGFTVLIDGNSEQAVVQDHINPINANKLTKYIHCSIDSLIKTGSLVNFENENYLVVTHVDSNLAYLTAEIQKSNHTLNFYINNQLTTSPAIITNKIGDINEDRYITLPDGKYKIILPANDNTNEITYDDRFVFYKQAWKVISIDYSVDGLVGLSVESDALLNNDNTTTDTPENDNEQPNNDNLW